MKRRGPPTNHARPRNRQQGYWDLLLMVKVLWVCLRSGRGLRINHRGGPAAFQPLSGFGLGCLEGRRHISERAAVTSGFRRKIIKQARLNTRQAQRRRTRPHTQAFQYSNGHVRSLACVVGIVLHGELYAVIVSWRNQVYPVGRLATNSSFARTGNCLT